MKRAPEYLPFIAAFPLILGLASHRATRTPTPARSAGDMVEDVLATFFVTRLVAREKIGKPMRDAVADPAPDAPVQRALEELVTCTRCLGPWVATAITAGRTFAPQHARVATRVGALAGANILLHAAFARATDPPSGSAQTETLRSDTARPDGRQ